MKLTIGTRLGLGFGSQMLLTGLLGAGVLISMDRVERDFQAVVEHDTPVLANAKQLPKLVVDMETGQQGFVITGQDEFLEPYDAGRQAFDVLMARQIELVSDDPAQVSSLGQIQELVHQWEETAAGPEIAMARKIATHKVDAGHL